MTDPTEADPLDAYLDGQLEGDALAAFEARLRDEPDLAAQVELQGKVDAALAAAIPAAPDAEAVLARAIAQASEPEGKVLRPSFWRPALVAVAAALLLLLGWDMLQGPAVEYDPATQLASGPRRAVAEIYRAEVDEGLTPDWVCKDDAEFIGTFKKRLGQGLVLGAAPASVAPVGLSYHHSITRKTVTVLARVDDRPVLVFVDVRGRGAEPPAPAPGLHLHRRELGSLVLYELSPHPEARVLPLFELRD